MIVNQNKSEKAIRKILEVTNSIEHDDSFSMQNTMLQWDNSDAPIFLGDGIGLKYTFYPNTISLVFNHIRGKYESCNACHGAYHDISITAENKVTVKGQAFTDLTKTTKEYFTLWFDISEL
ncbi:hypothetical protein [Halodesulfovibrio sp. MK-HDV]|jgi:hypothetical protein|uniref:hypothetical protein n=1 Tax=Halodesulfovibrio sp. MK-HDV TaxID=2599925 RepID=UPI001368EB76|nr:hypothetical protein [Halodesulfovibrio sp. MK-HDV]KAF1073458.1 hypothetical protein MKHDV_03592 [Halodesulfovibrio sp. MK-HDV]